MENAIATARFTAWAKRLPGPESTCGSRENQSKALNRRRIDEQLSPLIGLLIGLQLGACVCIHLLSLRRRFFTPDTAPPTTAREKRALTSSPTLTMILR